MKSSAARLDESEISSLAGGFGFAAGAAKMALGSNIRVAPSLAGGCGDGMALDGAGAPKTEAGSNIRVAPSDGGCDGGFGAAAVVGADVPPKTALGSNMR